MWLTGNIFILLKEDAAQWGEDIFEVEFKFYKYTSYPLVVCSGSQILNERKKSCEIAMWFRHSNTIPNKF